MRVLLFGASRNIGHYVTQRLLAHGHTCTLLLRNVQAIESDSSLASYLSDGKLKTVRGDGLVEEDVQQAWNVAKGDGDVDAVFFGIGGYPSFSLTKGIVLEPADLTARCMSVLLGVVQSNTTGDNRPKIATITANGLDKHTHDLLPFVLRKFAYGALLDAPHKDKREQEVVVKRAAGWSGSEEEGSGWLGSKNLVIIQPSVYTNGECVADKKKDMEGYRTSDNGLSGAWSISRADVGHFVAEKVLLDWDKWAGKAWVISY